MNTTSHGVQSFPVKPEALMLCLLGMQPLDRRQIVKKIDVEKDLKRSKFLIKAMVAQIVIVLVVMFVYWAYLKS